MNIPFRLIPLLLTAHCAYAEPIAFSFETPEAPAICALGSGRATSTRSDTVRHEPDAERGGNVCVTGDASRGGIFVTNPQGAAVMDEALTSLTLAMAFRSSPVSQTPNFVERLVSSSSANPGFFRFRAQRNGGDDHERRGTLRFGATGEGGKSHQATSSIPWTQVEGAWNWVGVVFNDGEVTFYLNGEVLGDTVPFGLKRIPGAESKSHYLRAGYGFEGAFDDLVILPNKALSPEEMRALYQHGPAHSNVKPTLQK